MRAYTNFPLNSSDTGVHEVQVQAWDGTQWVKVKYDSGGGLVDARNLFEDEQLTTNLKLTKTNCEVRKPSKLWN